MINALSIDVEEWYHPELLRSSLKDDEKTSQISKSIMPILGLLDKYATKATFFVLGEVAEKNPDVIKTIYAKGHEIASHGMSHKPLWEIGEGGFAQEIQQFDRVIKNILGEEINIRGFRAPSFSLDNSTRWALGILKKNGYAYDSSVFPLRNKLYGVKDAPLDIYKPSLADLRKVDPEFDFMEFPLPACDLFGLRTPVAGGFYFRVMPLWLLKTLLKKINRQKRPFVFYLHPWESDNNIPRVKDLSPLNYFITYWGVHRILNKLEDLLKTFSFVPIREVLKV